MATTTTGQEATPAATGQQSQTGGGPQGAAPTGRAPGGRPRVRVGELISAGSALLLLVLMFATKWYGVAGVPDPSYARPAVSGAEDGWNGLTVVRWVLLVTILAAVGAVLLHVSQRKHGTKTDTSRVVATLGVVSSALLVYRVLIDLPGDGRVIDQKLGAVLGLLCALGIAWGGWESLRQRRAAAGARAVHRARRGTS